MAIFPGVAYQGFRSTQVQFFQRDDRFGPWQEETLRRYLHSTGMTSLSWLGKLWESPLKDSSNRASDSTNEDNLYPQVTSLSQHQSQPLITKSSGYRPSSAEVKQMPGQGHIIEHNKLLDHLCFPIQTDPSVMSLKLLPLFQQNPLIQALLELGSTMDKLSVYGLQSFAHVLTPESSGAYRSNHTSSVKDTFDPTVAVKIRVRWCNKWCYKHLRLLWVCKALAEEGKEGRSRELQLEWVWPAWLREVVQIMEDVMVSDQDINTFSSSKIIYYNGVNHLMEDGSSGARLRSGADPWFSFMLKVLPEQNGLATKVEVKKTDED
ncbi:hypothetical protein HPP92_021786 [Vanilla planifolia]|uniref:Uncharacterized protein n=1 Tax=Vanilla planifolia TaxID=51239 RepID=A0A835Q1U0_VANPL|nr:hypothetical protein HPP92_021786 [Vanilla planifolia]